MARKDDLSNPQAGDNPHKLFLSADNRNGNKDQIQRGSRYKSGKVIITKILCTSLHRQRTYWNQGMGESMGTG